MKSRRDRHRFRPTLDALSLRLSPGGLTPLPDNPYLDPTGPRDTPSEVVGTNPDDYLEPGGPTTPC